MTTPLRVEALREQVARAFADQLGVEPQFWVRSPGRVNLIGEHTDYNEGFVLPIAIERQAIFAACPRPDSAHVRIYSATLGDSDDFDPRDFQHADGWRDYARGVAWALRGDGYSLPAVDIALASDVPLGAGLSSSAAFEVGLGWTLAHAAGQTIDRVRLAQLMQRAENGWVGVATGIMDQFIAALGKQDHALLIDTRDLSYQTVPLPQSVSVVIADTNVKRGLVASEYNARRAETAEAARLLGVPSLRDVSAAEFDRRAVGLPSLLRRRAHHVVFENDRVLRTVEALAAGDVATAGDLMDASHRSLRDDYQVSHPNLDLLVDLARRQPGVHGARMTGAGFGGATVSLVDEGAVDDFRHEVARAYAEATGQPPPIYVTRATDGVAVIA